MVIMRGSHDSSSSSDEADDAARVYPFSRAQTPLCYVTGEAGDSEGAEAPPLSPTSSVASSVRTLGTATTADAEPQHDPHNNSDNNNNLNSEPHQGSDTSASPLSSIIQSGTASSSSSASSSPSSHPSAACSSSSTVSPRASCSFWLNAQQRQGDAADAADAAPDSLEEQRNTQRLAFNALVYAGRPHSYSRRASSQHDNTNQTNEAAENPTTTTTTTPTTTVTITTTAREPHHLTDGEEDAAAAEALLCMPDLSYTLSDAEMLSHCTAILQPRVVEELSTILTRARIIGEEARALDAEVTLIQARISTLLEQPLIFPLCAPLSATPCVSATAMMMMNA